MVSSDYKALDTKRQGDVKFTNYTEVDAIVSALFYSRAAPSRLGHLKRYTACTHEIDRKPSTILHIGDCRRINISYIFLVSTCFDLNRRTNQQGNKHAYAPWRSRILQEHHRDDFSDDYAPDPYLADEEIMTMMGRLYCLNYNTQTKQILSITYTDDPAIHDRATKGAHAKWSKCQQITIGEFRWAPWIFFGFDRNGTVLRYHSQNSVANNHSNVMHLKPNLHVF